MECQRPHGHVAASARDFYNRAILTGAIMLFISSKLDNATLSLVESAQEMP
jgi:hypothetical protein